MDMVNVIPYSEPRSVEHLHLWIGHESGKDTLDMLQFVSECIPYAKY